MIITDDNVHRLMQARKALIDNDLVDSPEADSLMDGIRGCVLEGWMSLTIETIFEALTSIGASPSLLYDDNGMFAVLSEGYQQAYLTGHGNFEGKWLGELDDWKPTVREAVGAYIKKLEDSACLIIRS